MKCTRCKKARLRQQVPVFVDCDFECRSLSKKGIRSADVKILGAGWPQARMYCPRCGFTEELVTDKKSGAKARMVTNRGGK